MTIGIAFTNGLEAVVVTDSRVSGSGRQSDSVDKVGILEGERYAGVVFGAGSANVVYSVIRNLEDFSGKALDECVAAIGRFLLEGVDEEVRAPLVQCDKIITTKAALIQDDSKRKEYIEKETEKAQQGVEQIFREGTHTKTSLILVAYDKNSRKLRRFSISTFGSLEAHFPHIEIGSGSDGANMYLTTALQGLDNRTLGTNELVFFALNAHSLATINEGVGGTPNIVVVGQEGVKTLPDEKVIVLTNVSGAYMAREIETRTARELFSSIVNAQNPDYKRVAEVVGVSETTLRSMAIPYGTWQERANRKEFNGNKISAV